MKKIQTKEYSPKWYIILKDGLLGEDMEPKFYMRYEKWMHQLKIIVFTIIIGLSIIYITFNSPFITTSYQTGTKEDAGTLNRWIDYAIGKYDEWKDVESEIQKPKVFNANSIDTTLIDTTTIK
jgi:hypothetical protein